MRKIIQYKFSSTIALISGAPKYDLQVKNIAKTLSKVSKNEVSLVGVVGSEHQSLFSKVYASSDLLDNYEFQVTRAYNSYHQDIQDSAILPYRSYTHFRNYLLVKQLQKQNFFAELFEKGVSTVATVGNFSLALRIGEKLNEYCKLHNKVKPYSVLFHRQASQRTVQNEQFIDFQYYNIEKTLANSSGYIFPSLCIGYDGLYRALKHLQQYKRYNEEDTFKSQNFSYDVSELVKKSRASFRAARGISQDKYIIYIDAGETVDQINFSFKSFKNGLKVFMDKEQIKTISPSHFEIFVYEPADEKLISAIKGKLGFLPHGVNVTLIEEKDKYAAISASDFGLLHNGEATVQAAALQLPSLVVDNRTNFHAYFNNLFNGHASPLNIATNYEGYEDLCGSLTAIGQKLGSIILRNFQTPKLRYYYAKLYRDQIQKILSKSGFNTQLSVGETGLESGCHHLLTVAANYHKLDVNTVRKQSARKQALAL